MNALQVRYKRVTFTRDVVWLCYVTVTRDVAWQVKRKGKTQVGGCSLAVLCLAPARTFRAADKAAVISHVTSGSEVWNPKGFLSTPLLPAGPRRAQPEGHLPLEGVPLYPVTHRGTSPQTGFKWWPTITSLRLHLASHAVVFRGDRIALAPHKRLLNREQHSFPIVRFARQPNQLALTHCLWWPIKMIVSNFPRLRSASKYFTSVHDS